MFTINQVNKIFFYIIYFIALTTLIFTSISDNLTHSQIVLSALFLLAVLLAQYFSFIWLTEHIKITDGKIADTKIHQIMLGIAALTIPIIVPIISNFNEETSIINLIVALFPIISVIFLVVSLFNKSVRAFKYGILFTVLFLNSFLLIIVTMILSRFIDIF